MKRKLKQFALIVLWAIALALSAQARADGDGLGDECLWQGAGACALREFETAVALMGDLRMPLSAQDFERGAVAIARARALGGTTERERELIDAVAQFYHRSEERTHDMRLVHYERALSHARSHLPGDVEIAMLHAHASRVALARARERAEAAYARRSAPFVPTTEVLIQGAAK